MKKGLRRNRPITTVVCAGCIAQRKYGQMQMIDSQSRLALGSACFERGGGGARGLEGGGERVFANPPSPHLCAPKCNTVVLFSFLCRVFVVKTDGSYLIEGCLLLIPRCHLSIAGCFLDLSYFAWIAAIKSWMFPVDS